MYVKVASGLVIRDPVFLDLLPDEGRDVPDDSDYWQRRLLDGDVVLAKPPAAAPAIAAAPAQALKSTSSD